MREPELPLRLLSLGRPSLGNLSDANLLTIY
jgi:hypothetical protein